MDPRRLRKFSITMERQCFQIATVEVEALTAAEAYEKVLQDHPHQRAEWENTDAADGFPTILIDETKEIE